MIRKIAALSSLVSFVACKSGPSTLTTSDAAPITSTASPTTPTQSDDPVIDLLHGVEATVATSSRVDNAHDHPEHLVDGKQETAWNGKTGDLHGWIAFRLPQVTKVTRVELAVGFDKKTPEGDLFTMNHRIKRVRLSKGGAPVREVTLDVDVRTPQAIDLDDVPGGDFRLEVLETVPGTKKEWRELTVSELRVWGHGGGAPRNPTHLPKLAVGSLEGVPTPKPLPKADIPRGPFTSIAQLCTAIDRVVQPALRMKFGEDAFSGGARCKVGEQYGLDPKTFEGGPFDDATLIDYDDFEEDRTSLAVRTPKGWFRTDVHVRSHVHMDPGCMDAVRDRVEDVRIAKTATGQPVAILRVVERETKWANPQPSENSSVWTETVYGCRLDSAQAPSCEGPKVLATTKAPNPPDFTFDHERFFAVDLVAIPWRARKTAVLGPSGDLRVE
jgi:hypothetical protein